MNVVAWDQQNCGFQQQRAHIQLSLPPKLLRIGYRIARGIPRMTASRHPEHTIAGLNFSPHNATPFKCLFEARLQICNDQARKLTLHLGPQGNHKAASDDIVILADSENIVTPVSEENLRWVKSESFTNSCRQQKTTHFFFSDGNLIQVYCEPLPRLHWPTNRKCCQLKDLKQYMKVPTVTVRLHPTRLGQYIVYTDGAAH